MFSIYCLIKHLKNCHIRWSTIWKAFRVYSRRKLKHNMTLLWASNEYRQISSLKKSFSSAEIMFTWLGLIFSFGRSITSSAWLGNINSSLNPNYCNKMYLEVLNYEWVLIDWASVPFPWISIQLSPFKLRHLNDPAKTHLLSTNQR